MKGVQFIKEDGTWQNPFDHFQDDLFEAKHKCLLENGVHIIYDISDYLSYIEDKYGKDYIKQFRRNTNDDTRH